MKTVKYGVIKEDYLAENRPGPWYGIAAYYCEEVDGTWVVFESVHDVTNDLERINDLADKCNRYGLSPEHLRGVVEDFLAAWRVKDKKI
ncbi:MAG: hypothetical protein IKI03_00410 [Clostridia bacterium]|nr:hypothetical protein [Clostridia bacterium]